MTESDFPAPNQGFVLTHFLVVSDQDKSREFYRKLFDANRPPRSKNTRSASVGARAAARA
jgi:hypothetical protein